MIDLLDQQNQNIYSQEKLEKDQKTGDEILKISFSYLIYAIHIY